MIEIEPVQIPASPNGAHSAPNDVRAARAAGVTGVAPDRIERLPFDLSEIDENGCFLNVDAAGFGILDRALDWESLGVTLPPKCELSVRPPRCGLIPDRHRLPLLRPASQAHSALRRYSYHFTLTETLFESPSYRWVPWRAFPEFEREFGEAQASLAAAKAAVVADYPQVREEVIATFLRLGIDSARRLRSTGHEVPIGFEDAVVRGALRALPSAEDLSARLSLRYRVGVMLLGSEMLAEQRKAREERARIEALDVDARLVRVRADAESRLVQSELFAKEERLRREREIAESEARREVEVKERIRTLKLQAARERLQESLSPLEEGARQLHAAVYDSAFAIRDSLAKNGHLPGSTVRRARELAKWFQLMNWQSDDRLEALVGELESLASRPKGRGRRRPVGEVDAVLADIVELTYADARLLSEPSRLSALEV